MGTDEKAVTDPTLKVRRMEGLRDASTMPTMVRKIPKPQSS
ncbi:GMC oxidoreductase [Sinorhizobium sp. M4_45]